MNLRIGNLLAHQLGNSVTFLHLEYLVSVVEHHNTCNTTSRKLNHDNYPTNVLTDIPPVVLVHDPGPDVDVLLPGEAGPGRHSAVGAAGDADLNVRLHEALPAGGDAGVLWDMIVKYLNRGFNASEAEDLYLSAVKVVSSC